MNVFYNAMVKAASMPRAPEVADEALEGILRAHGDQLRGDNLHLLKVFNKGYAQAKDQLAYSHSINVDMMGKYSPSALEGEAEKAHEAGAMATAHRSLRDALHHVRRGGSVADLPYDTRRNAIYALQNLRVL